MAAKREAVAGEGRERRYYAVPDDRCIKVASAHWQEHIFLSTAYEVVGDAVSPSARMSVSLWHGNHVATLYTSTVYDAPHVQAVSGWGSTPGAAMLELAFRWSVLMGRSWLCADHVVRHHLRDVVTGRVNSTVAGER